ncbi:MAG: hypothetical protein A3E83_04140 [Gammaproteobacteria bacterium RIFCSPHIGHO2_12_FULL_41_20]|nr:MAG: hypothetical protein A3E83_04140 [Gammaproteobacteria bacterium RIFCSPHIGHO2_12_FULL_41_20]
MRLQKLLFIFILTFSTLGLCYAHAGIEAVNDSYTVFSTPRNLQPFQLTTNKNTAFTEKNLQNHWTLLFFGFTHCPRICPVTLAKMEQVNKQLHAKNPSVQYVLVTVDPDRDTTTVLDEYVNKFNSAFVGVTGKEKMLQQLEKQLGVVAQRVPEANGDYSMEHSTSILLVNPQGQWVGILPYSMSSKAIAQAVEKAIG